MFGYTALVLILCLCAQCYAQRFKPNIWTVDTEPTNSLNVTGMTFFHSKSDVNMLGGAGTVDKPKEGLTAYTSFLAQNRGAAVSQAVPNIANTRSEPQLAFPSFDTPTLSIDTPRSGAPQSPSRARPINTLVSKIDKRLGSRQSFSTELEKKNTNLNSNLDLSKFGILENKISANNGLSEKALADDKPFPFSQIGGNSAAGGKGPSMMASGDFVDHSKLPILRVKSKFVDTSRVKMPGRKVEMFKTTTEVRITTPPTVPTTKPQITRFGNSVNNNQANPANVVTSNAGSRNDNSGDLAQQRTNRNTPVIVATTPIYVSQATPKYVTPADRLKVDDLYPTVPFPVFNTDNPGNPVNEVLTDGGKQTMPSNTGVSTANDMRNNGGNGGIGNQPLDSTFPRDLEGMSNTPFVGTNQLPGPSGFPRDNSIHNSNVINNNGNVVQGAASVPQSFPNGQIPLTNSGPLNTNGNIPESTSNNRRFNFKGQQFPNSQTSGQPVNPNVIQTSFDDQINANGQQTAFNGQQANTPNNQQMDINNQQGNQNNGVQSTSGQVTSNTQQNSGQNGLQQNSINSFETGGQFGNGNVPPTFGGQQINGQVRTKGQTNTFNQQMNANINSQIPFNDQFNGQAIFNSQQTNGLGNVPTGQQLTTGPQATFNVQRGNGITPQTTFNGQQINGPGNIPNGQQITNGPQRTFNGQQGNGNTPQSMFNDQQINSQGTIQNGQQLTNGPQGIFNGQQSNGNIPQATINGQQFNSQGNIPNGQQLTNVPRGTFNSQQGSGNIPQATLNGQQINGKRNIPNGPQLTNVPQGTVNSQQSNGNTPQATFNGQQINGPWNSPNGQQLTNVPQGTLNGQQGNGNIPQTTFNGLQTNVLGNVPNGQLLTNGQQLTNVPQGAFNGQQGNSNTPQTTLNGQQTNGQGIIPNGQRLRNGAQINLNGQQIFTDQMPITNGQRVNSGGMLPPKGSQPSGSNPQTPIVNGQQFAINGQQLLPTGQQPTFGGQSLNNNEQQLMDNGQRPPSSIQQTNNQQTFNGQQLSPNIRNPPFSIPIGFSQSTLNTGVSNDLIGQTINQPVVSNGASISNTLPGSSANGGSTNIMQPTDINQEMLGGSPSMQGMNNGQFRSNFSPVNDPQNNRITQNRFNNVGNPNMLQQRPNFMNTQMLRDAGPTQIGRSPMNVPNVPFMGNNNFRNVPNNNLQGIPRNVQNMIGNRNFLMNRGVDPFFINRVQPNFPADPRGRFAGSIGPFN